VEDTQTLRKGIQLLGRLVGEPKPRSKE
jgi:hypothetical protein